MIGTITDKQSVSEYQPSQEVKDLTAKIKKDYAVGYDIQHRVFAEFNDVSFLSRMDNDQKAFNNYVQSKSSC